MDTIESPRPRVHSISTLFARVLAIALLIGTAALLGSTYFGHSSSPYGVCYCASGRSIPCAVAVR